MKLITIRNGFIVAGAVNVAGILSFTRVLTDDAISQLDPVVMSKFGLVIIMLWGLASIAMTNVYSKANAMVGILAIEKLIYVIAWGIWITKNDLTSVYATDFAAGIYYTIYGPMDFVFLIFFTWVFLSHNKRTH